MNALERRILDISYRKKLAHIGSCLTAVNIIDEIYELKKREEPFILSSGHAGLALYVVLEKQGYGDAELLFDLHGVHPNRDVEHGIWCSTGSLGHGIGVAVGMALADKERHVWCLISDGEAAEGSVWEALRIAGEQEVENLNVYVNANGYGAYREINVQLLGWQLIPFFPVHMRATKQKYLFGQDAHYHNLTKEEYEKIIFDDPVLPRI